MEDFINLSVYLSSGVGYALFCLLVTFLLATFFVRRLKAISAKTSNLWDDVVFGTGAVSPIIWVVGISVSASFLVNLPVVVNVLVTIITILLVANAVHKLLSGISANFAGNERARKVNVRGFVQVLVVSIYLFAAILVVSVIKGQSLGSVMVSLWGLALGLTFIFKDVIQNLLSGMYLVLSGKIQLGDWVVLESKRIDGEVVEIGLITSAVRQWDQTITSIQTKDLMNTGFKNWRHINDAKGRRIKERFWVSQACVGVPPLREDIESSLAACGFEELSVGVMDSIMSQRTNIGVFREYLFAMLQSKTDVYADHLTTLVRTLEPTPKGIPVQIYTFSLDTNWVNFEKVRSQLIEDVLLLATGVFDLELFELASEM